MAFTGLATKAYKGAIDVVWANSIQGNDNFLLTGMAKAWVNFDGTAGGPTNITSFNVASVTRISVGCYRVTFTTGFSTASVAVGGGFAWTNGFDNFISSPLTAVNPFSSVSVVFALVNNAGAQRDADMVSMVFLGPQTGL